MSELLAPLPGLAAHHLLLSAAALGLALVVSAAWSAGLLALRTRGRPA